MEEEERRDQSEGRPLHPVQGHLGERGPGSSGRPATPLPEQEEQGEDVQRGIGALAGQASGAQEQEGPVRGDGDPATADPGTRRREGKQP